jgi:uncharacterized protein YndB with AHSA1/START domain
MSGHGPELRVTPRGDREIVFTRRFAAPAAAVFHALTTPDLVQRWLTGPPGVTMPVCEMDVRPGGAYRWVWRMPDGGEMAAAGAFREVAAPHRLVQTERFDPPWYEGEAVVTTELVEEDGATLFTAVLAYESRAVREAVLGAGMETGVAPSYDRLEALARA